MVISTREPQKTREEVLNLDIFQISGASSTSIGGYAVPEKEEGNSAQFDVSGNRALDEVVSRLLKPGYMPSLYTTCYREGRTKDRFISLAKSGRVVNCCHPNASLTLREHLDDYAKEDTKKPGSAVIDRESLHILDEEARESHASYLHSIDNGKRDFRL